MLYLESIDVNSDGMVPINIATYDRTGLMIAWDVSHRGNEVRIEKLHHRHIHFIIEICMPPLSKGLFDKRHIIINRFLHYHLNPTLNLWLTI